MSAYLRRARLAATVIVSLLIVLVAAGCSAPDESASSSDTDYAPVTIDHEYGSTTINARPTRVVTLLTNWTDTLAALNIPITARYVEKGYAGANNEFPWTPKNDAQVKVVDSMSSIDIGDIAALNPDIILAGYLGDRSYYDRLSAIAPTIPVMKSGATVDTWEDLATAAGRIFTQQDAAKKLIATTQGNIDTFKAQHPAAMGKTFTFAQFQPTGNIGAINSTEDPAAGLLAQLGFTLNPKLAALHTGSATRTPISTERIDLLDSDLLVAWTLGDRSTLEKVPGWNSLTAVRDNTVVYLTNDNAPAFGVPSAPSVNYVISLLDPVAARMK